MPVSCSLLCVTAPEVSYHCPISRRFGCCCFFLPVCGIFWINYRNMCRPIVLSVVSCFIFRFMKTGTRISLSVPADTAFHSPLATPGNHSKWENGVKCFLEFWSNASKYIPDVKPLSVMQIQHGLILSWPLLNLFHLVLATHLRFFFEWIWQSLHNLNPVWLILFKLYFFFLTLMKINWSLDMLLMLIYFLQLQNALISTGNLYRNIQPKSSPSR